MAAARLVVNDWGEKYVKILLKSGIKIRLKALYVDDMRQGTSRIRHGVRFSHEEEKFIYKEEWEQEDREAGESDTKRMARQSREAMNSIYANLNFTVEIEEDFSNMRLPTLDFNLFVHNDCEIRHSFFEKPCNTPYVVMERSAMGEQAKHSILAQDLIRRLSNVGEALFEEEKLQVINAYTEKLKVSGYNRKQTREIVISGLRGYNAKKQRAAKSGKPFYRLARDTLKARIKKKLTEKTKWYKTKKSGEREKPYENRGGKTKRKINKSGTKNTVKAVVFVPRTRGGELARELRDKEYELEKLTGYRLKIVERAGVSLERLLHQSNPWQGEICGRDSCMLCQTKLTSEEQPKSCYKRNAVYQISCSECDALAKTDETKMRSLYIGETCRSSFERGREHLDAREDLKPDSHMLKHVLLHHEEKQDEVHFDMTIKKFHRSAFERQVHESVIIQASRNNSNLMNSRAEFNRCSIPRLGLKMGQKVMKEKGEEEELLLEIQLEERIKKMQKIRRADRVILDEPKRKRRRLNKEERKFQTPIKICPSSMRLTPAAKRKNPEDDNSTDLQVDCLQNNKEAIITPRRKKKKDVDDNNDIRKYLYRKKETIKQTTEENLTVISKEDFEYLTEAEVIDVVLLPECLTEEVANSNISEEVIDKVESVIDNVVDCYRDGGVVTLFPVDKITPVEQMDRLASNKEAEDSKVSVPPVDQVQPEDLMDVLVTIKETQASEVSLLAVDQVQPGEKMDMMGTYKEAQDSEVVLVQGTRCASPTLPAQLALPKTKSEKQQTFLEKFNFKSEKRESIEEKKEDLEEKIVKKKEETENIENRKEVKTVKEMKGWKFKDQASGSKKLTPHSQIRGGWRGEKLL